MTLFSIILLILGASLLCALLIISAAVVSSRSTKRLHATSSPNADSKTQTPPLTGTATHGKDRTTTQVIVQ